MIMFLAVVYSKKSMTLKNPFSRVTYFHFQLFPPICFFFLVNIKCVLLVCFSFFLTFEIDKCD